MLLGTRIRELREGAGLSQAALARAAGISQNVIAELEAGTQLTTKKLPKIAQALGVDVADVDIEYASGRGGHERGPRLIFAAVEEAFIQAGFPSETATKIAGVIQLVIVAQPPAPPGMTSEDVVRKIVRWELSQFLPPEPKARP